MFEINLSASENISDFITPLAQTINLNGDWLIALKEISLPNTFVNFTTGGFAVVFDGIIQDIQIIEFNSGRFTRETFIEYVNQKILDQCVETDHAPSEVPQLEYNKITGLVIQKKISSRLELYFSDSIRGYLGGTISKPLSYGILHKVPSSRMLKLYSDYPLHINIIKYSEIDPTIPDFGDDSGGIRSILVNVDIVDHIAVGDTDNPVLKIVHVKSVSKFGDQMHYAYNNPEFKPLLKKDFHSIAVRLNDESGQIIKFLDGKVKMTLVFKPKE